MQWPFEQRARLVSSVAHGEAGLADMCDHEGIEPTVVASWVAECLLVAPECFDEAMMRRLEEQGLARSGARTRQHGRLEDVSALDLLQSLGIYKKAGHVRLIHAHGTSQLWFRDAEIVDAASGALRGVEAVARIVGHDRGDFLVEVLEHDRPQTIELPTMALVLEAARRLDEAHRLDAQLPAQDEVSCRTAEAPAGSVADLFGEGSTLGEVLERSTLGELLTRKQVVEALARGWLRPTGDTRAAVVPGVHERAATLRRLELERSQALVAVPSVVVGEYARPSRRSWGLALGGGFVAASIALGMGLGAREGARDEAAPAMAMVMASVEDGMDAEDTAAVGMPRGPAPDGDDEAAGALELVPTLGPEMRERSGSAQTAVERRSTRSARAPRGEPDRSAPRPELEPRRAPPELSAEDPATLLGRARAAYASGQGAAAYRLALRSQRARPSEGAAELMTLAACQMGDSARAFDALRAVPLLRRAGVRAQCKREHGVRPRRER
ncbi:MAG: DUF4388 domain-containing protein [Myxococcales bacterium]|nr:DUF4388 domain-containing protein [Myxococcales bacterium]